MGERIAGINLSNGNGVSPEWRQSALVVAAIAALPAVQSGHARSLSVANPQAAASLPQIGRHELVRGYPQAFTRLLHVLIVITLGSAFASFAFLSRAGSPDDQSDESQRKVAQSAAV